MVARKIPLFTVYGFKVSIDLTWPILAVLVTVSLAGGVFPQNYAGLSRLTYWLMGLIGALLLFASIVFHELWHSLVARRYGLAMRGITLFIFGGIAEMSDEPQKPKVELLTAIAGPAASVLLGALMYGLALLGGGLDWPVPVIAVLSYLAVINWVLAIFNLLPAFPMDGGRVMRSLLWSWRGDLHWATRVATVVSRIFSVLLMVWGGLGLLAGNVIGGFWLIIIGLFLHGAAQSGYQQLLIRDFFNDRTVREFMREDPITVPPETKLNELIEDFVYRHHTESFPLAVDGGQHRYIDLERVRRVPREVRDRRTVGELAQDIDERRTVGADDPMHGAFRRLQESGADQLFVLTGDRITGTVHRRDLQNLLSMRMRLEK